MEKKPSPDKKITKKVWFWLLIAFIALIILLGGCAGALYWTLGRAGPVDQETIREDIGKITNIGREYRASGARGDAASVEGAYEWLDALKGSGLIFDYEFYEEDILYLYMKPEQWEAVADKEDFAAGIWSGTEGLGMSQMAMTNFSSGKLYLRAYSGPDGLVVEVEQE